MKLLKTIKSKIGIATITFSLFLVLFILQFPLIPPTLHYFFGERPSLQHIEVSSENASYIISVNEGIYFVEDTSGYAILNGTDASTVIQSAINFLSNKGGIIFIERGTYEIHSKLALSSHTILMGEGDLTILEAMNGLLDSPCMIGDVSIPEFNIKSYNITVFNLSLHCNFVRMQHAIWLRYVQYATIDNVFVRDFDNQEAPMPRGGALDIGAVSPNGVITNCVSVNCWSVEGDFHVCGKNGRVENNYSYYALNCGIMSPREGNGTVAGNKVIGARGDGIVVDGSGLIVDNYIAYCRYGIFIVDRPEVVTVYLVDNRLFLNRKGDIHNAGNCELIVE